jgi:hypothetical protein
MIEIFYTATRIEFNLDTDFDLSAADEVGVFYTAPGGITGRWIGTFDADVINYTTGLTDIIIEGDWKFQASARFGTEWKYGDPLFRTFQNA